MTRIIRRLSGDVTPAPLILAALCLVLVSCSGKTGPVPAPEIRIGFIITTSEDRIRTNSWNLVDMFQNRFSDEQGLEVSGERHPVTFVTREIEGGIPEQAVRAVKELVNQDDVVAIIGPHYSIDAIPAGEMAEQAGVPLLSPTSTHPSATAGRKYVFRAAFLDPFQSRAMARFSMLDLEAEKLAVLFNIANPYSRGLAEVFRATVIQEGGRISSYESYTSGEKDFSAQLERIKIRSPDALYLPNFPEETESIVGQARDLGIGAILLGVDSWDSPRFSKIDQFYGAYVTSHMSPDSLTGERKFLSDEFLSRYGHELDDGAALTYDTIGILLHAIQYAGSFEPDAIRNALYEMGPYEGVTGNIDFIDSGDLEREAVILRLEKGRTSLVKKIVTRYEVGPRGLEER